jgi:hypothetical protein
LQPHPSKQQHHSAPSPHRRAAVLCRAQNVHQYTKAAVTSTTPRGVQLAANSVVVRVWSMCGTLYNFNMINYSFVRWLQLQFLLAPWLKQPSLATSTTV